MPGAYCLTQVLEMSETYAPHVSDFKVCVCVYVCVHLYVSVYACVLCLCPVDCLSCFR